MAKKLDGVVVLSTVGMILGLAGTVVSSIANGKKTQKALEELVNKKLESK